jgi:RNA polymerase sigma-70 factor (ECF subfamily)
MTRLRVIPGGRAAGAASASDAASESTVGAGGLREFYDRYGGSVYGRCYYLLRDRAKAEDAMQDVFAKALTNIAGFRAEASPLTWLTKIATNHCLNLIRSEKAAWHRSFEEQEIARVARVAEDEGTAGPRMFEDREAVRKLLANVDLETQAAAIHYYVDEMTLEEVAAVLGRSVPTVRKRLEVFAAQSGGEGTS